MAKKEEIPLSKVLRLSQTDLLHHFDAWGLVATPSMLEMELRAQLARAMAGPMPSPAAPLEIPSVDVEVVKETLPPSTIARLSQKKLMAYLAAWQVPVSKDMLDIDPCRLEESCFWCYFDFAKPFFLQTNSVQGSFRRISVGFIFWK